MYKYIVTALVMGLLLSGNFVHAQDSRVPQEAIELLGEAVCFMESAASIVEGDSHRDYDPREPFRIDFIERISRPNILKVTYSIENKAVLFEERLESDGEVVINIGQITKDAYIFTFVHLSKESKFPVKTYQVNYQCFRLDK